MKPIPEPASTGVGYLEDLSRGEFFLFPEGGGDVSLRFQSFQNVIGLTLTDMPDISKLRDKPLMQGVSVVGAFIKKT
jgi:hypothetical protein